MAYVSSKDDSDKQLSPQMCNNIKTMMKMEQGLRNASQMISRCQNMLYGERGKENHWLLLKTAVFSSEGWGGFAVVWAYKRLERKPREGCWIWQAHKLAVLPGKRCIFLIVNITNVANTTGRDRVISVLFSAVQIRLTSVSHTSKLRGMKEHQG